MRWKITSHSALVVQLVSRVHCHDEQYNRILFSNVHVNTSKPVCWSVCTHSRPHCLCCGGWGPPPPLRPQSIPDESQGVWSERESIFNLANFFNEIFRQEYVHINIHKF